MKVEKMGCVSPMQTKRQNKTQKFQETESSVQKFLTTNSPSPSIPILFNTLHCGVGNFAGQDPTTQPQKEMLSAP